MRPWQRGVIDVIDDLAAAIPVQLIGDLLGVPQDERGPLRQWSLAILGALEPVLTPVQFEQGVGAVDEFKHYLKGLAARRKDDTTRDGREILSTLIEASELGAASGGTDQLSELELIHNCIFLLNAGHETTTNLIGNSVDLLLRHHEVRHDLAHHPELIDTAIEEFLRMESSNQLGNRRAAKDTALSGVAIPAGSYVHLGIGAANRDPAQFPDPDRLDIRRAPNRHLASVSAFTRAGIIGGMERGSQLESRHPVYGIERPHRLRGGRARFRGFLHFPVAAASSDMIWNAAIDGANEGDAAAHPMLIMLIALAARRRWRRGRPLSSRRSKRVYLDLGGPGAVLAARWQRTTTAEASGKPIEIISADLLNKPDVACHRGPLGDVDGVDAITDVPTSVAPAVQNISREKKKFC